MSMRLNFKRFKPKNHGISVSAHLHLSQYMWIKILEARYQPDSVFLPESGQQPESGLEPDSKESYLNLIYLNQV